ncbi:MAG TPA: DinB family protein [Gemmatirosa sp.]
MSTAPAAPSLAQVSLGDLGQELATTRRVLERVPAEQWDWRPHPRSMTLGQLAGHIANLLLWGQHTLAASEVDLASPPPAPPRHATLESVLAAYDANAADVRARVGAATDEALGGTYTVRRGEQVMMAMPRAAMLRGMILSHLIHHRGQLSVYLRLLDVPVPAIYGPSADEGRF